MTTSISQPAYAGGSSVGRSARFSVEAVLWIAIFFLALALRVVNLDVAPLAPAEAREALAAWGAINDHRMPDADYSPLLFSANAALFALFGASDTVARLCPALFGVTLVITPLLIRQYLGRVATLLSGLFLALSPAALVSSRQLDGTSGAVLGGMLAFAGLASFANGRDRRWLLLFVGGLAMAIASGSSAYGLLVTLALAFFATARTTTGWRAQEMWGTLRPHALQMIGVFLFATLLVATALGWNPTGLGAVGDLFVDWLARFRRVSSGTASPFVFLIVYEPLVLVAGFAGAVGAVRRGNRFGEMLALWSGLGVLLLTLMPGRMPLDILWGTLPLTLLAGMAVGEHLRVAWEGRARSSEWLYVIVVLVLWVHCYMMLVRYASSQPPQRDQFLVLALLALLLQVLLAVVFTLLLQGGLAASRSVATGSGIVLLALTMSAGWGVAHVRPTDPREPLVHDHTASGVYDLVQTLRDLSWRETGVPAGLSLTVSTPPDSVLAWYLRGFKRADLVVAAELDWERAGPIVVTSGSESPYPVDEAYIGQDFVLHLAWAPTTVQCVLEWPLQCSSAVGWLLSRRTPSPPTLDEAAVIWLQEDWVSD